MNLAPITVAVHTLGKDSRQELIDDVRAGLTQTPKVLPPRWFYDDRGCELFEEITELDEYYQTRTERGILERHAPEIVAKTRSASIVELGAGSCTKSRVLIKAAKGMGTLWTFVPFDISEATIRRSASELAEEFDDLTVYCVAGEFDQHLDQIPRFGSQLVVFLGSTIGNFDATEARTFLKDVRRLMTAEDHFLLGVDLVKDVRELIAAYDDARGVTAQFNLNVLARINRELDADFAIDRFAHVALWNESESRVEMHLRSLARQTVRIPGAGVIVEFEAGELMRTEICGKYTRDAVERMLGDAGLELTDWFSDDGSRFALTLSRPA